MSAVISRLEQAAGADALLEETSGDPELTTAVLKYLLGQAAYGLPFADAIEGALRLIATGRTLGLARPTN